MSAQTRENAEQTQKHLQTAEKYLQSAEQSAAGTGDPALQQTVKRLKTETATTHQEITRKLGKEQG
jgi:hypothetical protein